MRRTLRITEIGIFRQALQRAAKAVSPVAVFSTFFGCLDVRNVSTPVKPQDTGISDSLDAGVDHPETGVVNHSDTGIAAHDAKGTDTREVGVAPSDARESDVKGE